MEELEERPGPTVAQAIAPLAHLGLEDDFPGRSAFPGEVPPPSIVPGIPFLVSVNIQDDGRDLIRRLTSEPEAEPGVFASVPIQDSGNTPGPIDKAPKLGGRVQPCARYLVHDRLERAGIGVEEGVEGIESSVPSSHLEGEGLKHTPLPPAELVPPASHGRNTAPADSRPRVPDRRPEKSFDGSTDAKRLGGFGVECQPEGIDLSGGRLCNARCGILCRTRSRVTGKLAHGSGEIAQLRQVGETGFSEGAVRHLGGRKDMEWLKGDANRRGVHDRVFGGDIKELSLIHI